MHFLTIIIQIKCKGITYEVEALLVETLQLDLACVVLVNKIDNLGQQQNATDLE